MTDMIERLRAPYYWMSGSNGYNEEENHAPFEAANEIERLRNRVAYLEFVSRTVQGEQIKLAADLMQEKIVGNRLRAALAPLVALAGAIRDDAEKATPGPWRIFMGDICVDGDDGDDRIVAGIGTSRGARSSVYSPIQAHKPEGKANARLIAATPDMADAIMAAADAAGGEG